MSESISAAQGEERTRTVVAWWPTRLDDGTRIWPGTRYTVREAFEEDQGGWSTGTWVVTARLPHRD